MTPPEAGPPGPPGPLAGPLAAPCVPLLRVFSSAELRSWGIETAPARWAAGRAGRARPRQGVWWRGGDWPAAASSSHSVSVVRGDNTTLAPARPTTAGARDLVTDTPDNSTPGNLGRQRGDQQQWHTAPVAPDQSEGWEDPPALQHIHCPVLGQIRSPWCSVSLTRVDSSRPGPGRRRQWLWSVITISVKLCSRPTAAQPTDCKLYWFCWLQHFLRSCKNQHFPSRQQLQTAELSWRPTRFCWHFSITDFKWILNNKHSLRKTSLDRT